MDLIEKPLAQLGEYLLIDSNSELLKVALIRFMTSHLLKPKYPAQYIIKTAYF